MRGRMWNLEIMFSFNMKRKTRFWSLSISSVLFIALAFSAYNYGNGFGGWVGGGELGE